MAIPLLLLLILSWISGSTDAAVQGPFRTFFPPPQNLYNDDNTTGDPLFLTPLIDAGNISEALKAARVSIPGQSSVESYAGYLTLNNPRPNSSDVHCNSNLFFWFFPSVHNSDTAPVVLWLQGGPGGSSLFGLFVEHGPFYITADLKAKGRISSWSQTHNMIYVDNPVGTGFSFTGNDSCYASNEDDVARDMTDVLHQFFKMFAHLSKNDFFVTGESYAGKYVPAVAHKIDVENHDPKSKQKHIALKGIAIGDGLCDPETMTNYGDFLFGIGLIDEEDLHYFKKAEDLQLKLIKQKKWIEAFQVFDNLLNGDLTGGNSFFKNATGFDFYFNYLETSAPKEFEYYPKYLDQPEIRKAIHVGNLTYNDGQKVEEHLMADMMQSVKPLIEDLVEKYKVLIYNGQMDIIIAWPLTESFITSMKWSGAQEYLKTKRNIWRVGSDLAGYSKVVKNFTQVLVRNSGHMIPFDQPKWAFDLINRFTSGKSFT